MALCTPGAVVKTLPHSLKCDFRNVEFDFGTWQAIQLENQLLDAVEDYSEYDFEPMSLEVSSRSRIVTLRAAGIHPKARCMEMILERIENVDFVMCIGDDSADDNMFKVLDESEVSSITCRVGNTSTNANYVFPSVHNVLFLIQSLTADVP